MTKALSFSFCSVDGTANAIARWENEGGALSAPALPSSQAQTDLLESNDDQAAYMTGLDVEGALRPFHSYPWAVPSSVIE